MITKIHEITDWQPGTLFQLIEGLGYCSEPTKDSWQKEYKSFPSPGEDVLMLLKVLPLWKSDDAARCTNDGYFMLMALFRDKVVYIPGVSEETFPLWFKKI